MIPAKNLQVDGSIDQSPVIHPAEATPALLNRGIASALMTVLCLLLGLILANTLRDRISLDLQNSSLNSKLSEYQAQLTQLQEENLTLSLDNETLLAEKDRVTDEILEEQGFTDLALRLSKVRMLAGFTEVTGPGITITLNDSTISDPSDLTQTGLIHSQDILYVVELLKSAGAQAIAVNGERIVNTSVISCLGPTVRINDARHPVPFIITAVCDTVTGRAIFEGDTYLAYRITSGVEIAFSESDEITIPAFTDQSKINEIYQFFAKES